MFKLPYPTVFSALFLLFSLLACGGQQESDSIAEEQGQTADTPKTITTVATKGSPEQLDFSFTPGVRIGKITSATTRKQLAAWYGEDQLRDTTLFHGSEIPLPGTVLFPNSRDRLEIIWPNGEEVEDMIITICHQGSRWYDQRTGVKVGATLKEVLEANQAPLLISNFNWEFGGYVTDFLGGELSGYPLSFIPPAENKVPSSVYGSSEEIHSNQLLPHASDIQLQGITFFMNDIPPIDLRIHMEGQRILDKIHSSSTRKDLEKTYAGYTQPTSIHLGEGFTTQGLLIYPNTLYEITVAFQEDHPEKIDYLTLYEGSQYFVGENEYALLFHVGMSLEALVEMNGAPIDFAGFGWDYGGTILSFNEGYLVNVGGRLAPSENAELNSDLLGDDTFSSEDPRVNASDIILRSFTIKAAR